MSLMIGVKHYPLPQPTKSLEDCAICLTKWNRKSQITELACKHIFCTPCIREAFRKVDESCPVCQEAILIDEDTAEKAEFYVMRFKWFSAKEAQTHSDEDIENCYLATYKALQYVDQFDELCLLRGEVETPLKPKKTCHQIFIGIVQAFASYIRF